MISGAAVDQAKVQNVFGDQPLEASTVSGELDTLMQDFEGGATPSWAAGAMRNANAQNGCTWARCIINGRYGCCTSSYGICTTYCSDGCS